MSPTGSRFHSDDSFVRAIMGPVGSGKSVTCTMEAFRRISTYAESGLNSRGLVVRNTYRELQDTTLNTWLDWLRPFGTMNHQTMMFVMELGETRHEVLFRALDRPGDIGKLLSLELTWAWLNEFRELQKPVFDMLKTRIGRYPARISYDKPPFFGIWMDTNPPDDLHWAYRLFEELRPEGHRLFRQPGGLTAEAENIDNLVEGYYERISQGQDDAWIDVYVNGNYGFVMDGRPVYPEWNDRLHVAESALVPTEQPVFVGLDFGLTPAATFMQQTTTGQWRVLDELVTEEMGAVRFGELLSQQIQQDYPEQEVRIFGDPAGEQRSQTDERTPFQILQAQNLGAVPASTNDFTIRREAVVRNLSRLTMAGEPGLLVSPRCKYLRRGMAGGYKYRLMQVPGEQRFAEKPEKNIYSHVCEALQYACIGAGEGAIVVGEADFMRPLNMDKLNRIVR